MGDDSVVHDRAQSTAENEKLAAARALGVKQGSEVRREVRHCPECGAVASRGHRGLLCPKGCGVLLERSYADEPA